MMLTRRDIPMAQVRGGIKISYPRPALPIDKYCVDKKKGRVVWVREVGGKQLFILDNFIRAACVMLL